MQVAHYQGWGRKLSKPTPETEIKNELQGVLLVLLEEKDHLQFKILMNDINANEKSQNFGEYSQVNYTDHAKQWTMCYRNFEYANTDTYSMWSPFIMF